MSCLFPSEVGGFPPELKFSVWFHPAGMVKEQHYQKGIVFRVVRALACRVLFFSFPEDAVADRH